MLSAQLTSFGEHLCVHLFDSIEETKMGTSPAVRKARWKAAHPERAREINRLACVRWRAANPDKWRSARKKQVAKWSAANPEKARSIDRRRKAKRKAAKLQANPAWADPKKIADIYRKAAELEWDVDHIVPLLSSKVCGLHVESNLQILPSNENRRKSNRWWPDMFEKQNV
jgi:hypothetical protein